LIFDQKGGLTNAEVQALILSTITVSFNESSFTSGNESDTGASLTMPNNNGTSLIFFSANIGGSTNSVIWIKLNDNGVDVKTLNDNGGDGGQGLHQLMGFYTAQNNGQIIKTRQRSSNGSMSSTARIFALHFNF